MNNLWKVVGGVALSLMLASQSQAGAFEANVDKCLSKHVQPRDASSGATVMLECTADNGKLSGCKAVEDSKAGKGFDKAAVCVAETMTLGSKSGPVKVPMKFPGEA